MTTIPASEIVNVIPSVLSAGGSALNLNMLMLTASTRVPIGTVASFPDAATVANFFGPSSNEAALASVYFQGFAGCTVFPGALLFAQYPTAAVSAYIRGGRISALSLSQLQSLSGSLNITMDAKAFAAANIDLSAATSFSSAATIIQTALNTALPAGGTAVVVTYDSVSGAFVITSGTTGATSTVAFATGTLAGSILMTSITGAVLSQGAAPATPAAFMAAAVGITQNWATFMTTFNPDTNGNANKLAFAAWTSSKGNRYAYICTDTDVSPTTQVPAATSLGYLIKQANYSGTYLVFNPTDLNLAAFVGGIAASIDFTQTNGRTTFAFRSQPGLVPSVTDAGVAANLIANGYNFYGAYATANQNFMFMQPGIVSGLFQWMDSFINQIQLNNSFQLSLMNLLANTKSIPYNAAGNAMIESSLSDEIEAALNFGTLRAGVTPSSSQAIQVNAAAGVNISTVLARRGWYLQVLTPSAAVRQSRGSPVCNFWYMDGESIQKINLASVNLQ